MATKIQKIARELNDSFSAAVGKIMKSTFDLDTQTTYDVFIMKLVTLKADGTDFTAQEMAFLRGFSDGHSEALNFVWAKA